MRKRVIIKVVLLTIIVLVAAAALYLTFFYAKSCGDINCFNSALAECDRRSYIENTENAVWSSEIKGRDGEDCMIRVELLQMKQGGVELENLENKDMLCSLPLGVVSKPRDNLQLCHGLLKEELQGLIIDNLHTYLAENLGQISEELNKPL